MRDSLFLRTIAAESRRLGKIAAGETAVALLKMAEAYEAQALAFDFADVAET